MSTLPRRWPAIPLALTVMLGLMNPPLHAQTASSSLGDLIKSLPTGTGYAALDLCSRALATGDDFNRVKTQYTAPKVAPLPSFWTVTHSADKVTATAALLYARKAVLRPGLGCTLITPGSSEAEVRAQPFRVAPALPPDTRAWPLGEGPAQAGTLSPARQTLLQSAAKAMFTETTTDAASKINTNALLVAQDGQLVFEQYSATFDRNRLQLGWSMTKSLTALIAGVMERDGRLSLDGSVGLAAWAGTDRAAITWRQLLNMAPGLQWNEGGYGIGQDDTTQMLFSQPDQCAWAATKPLSVTPGTVFNYSTGFANLALCRLKELAGGSQQQIYDYYQQRLFAPLGIRQAYIEPDAVGSPLGGSRGMLRPVDWLRLGQLLAQGGRWQGQALLNAEYARFMVGPSPANAGYGGFVWRQPSTELPEDLRKQLPADLVYFDGFQGQYVVIVPSRGLVLLRMGVAFDSPKALRQTLQLVIDWLAQP